MSLIPAGKWIDSLRTAGTVREAAGLSLDARLHTVAYHLPLAAYHARYDIEHVHRLRVSTRRAMAAVRLYSDFLPRKRVKRVKRWLKRVRRAAGEARDLDVLIGRLPSEYGERATPVVALAGAARAASQPAIERAAQRFHTKDRYHRLVARLLDALNRSRDRDRAELEQDFRSWARKQLASQAEDFVATMPANPRDISELHAFRIRTKALRYALELLSAGLDATLRDRHYRTVEELQERLGRINDHAAARERLRQWAEAEADPQTQDLLCAMAVNELSRTADELAGFSAWWTSKRAEQLRIALTVPAERI